MKSRVCCALCNGEAATYCSSDSAFLCLICDAKVHEANFLVARHVRQIVCSNCKGFTGDHISGMGFQASGQICQSCSPASAIESAIDGDDLDSLSSCSSSACVSTKQSSSRRNKTGSRRWRRGKLDSPTSATATAKKGQTRPWRVDSKGEGILVNWCMRLGLMSGDVADVVRMASDALGVCLDQLMILPFRVSLAASLWFGFRFCEIRSLSTWHAIKRLEEISGVPAKLISAAESKLELLFKAANKQRRQSHHHQLLEEGWAES